MSRDEVAQRLGIAPNSVRDTLRRYGITEERGYNRAAVEQLRRPGKGWRKNRSTSDNLSGNDPSSDDASWPGPGQDVDTHQAGGGTAASDRTE